MIWRHVLSEEQRTTSFRQSITLVFLFLNINPTIDVELTMEPKIPTKYIVWLLVIWLAAFPYSLMFSEVAMGSLRKEGIREWAKPYYNLFATVPFLTPIGHVLWILSIVVIFFAPLPLFVLIVLKIIECVHYVFERISPSR